MTLPDPQTINTSFPDYATAVASFIDAGVEFIRVGSLEYRRHPAPAAWDALMLTNGGTVGWDHNGEWLYPEHAGIVGKEISAEDQQNAPSLVDCPDESTELQALFDYQIASGAKLSGGTRKIYGTTTPLFCGRDSTGANFGVNYLTVKDLKIGVVGGTWTSSDWVLVFGNSVVGTNGSTFRYCNIQDVWVDGGVDENDDCIAHNGVFFSRLTQGFIRSVKTVHCSAILQQIGNNAVLGSGGVNDCGDTVFDLCWGRQWLFGDTNYNVWANTTATGLIWRSDDNKIRNPNMGQIRRGLEVYGFSQGDLYGGHFWCGAGAEAEASGPEALYMENCQAVRLHGVRFDQGALVFKGAFTNVFLIGCDHSQYTHTPVRLIATEANTDLRSFGFRNCNMRAGNSTATLSTEGSGSWDSTLRPVLFGNVGSSGQPFTIDTRQNGQRLGALWQNTDDAAFDRPISGPGGRLVESGITASTGNLENIAHAINTTDKYAYKRVINTTTGIEVYAAGAAAGDVWIKTADGTTEHTPV